MVDQARDPYFAEVQHPFEASDAAKIRVGNVNHVKAFGKIK